MRTTSNIPALVIERPTGDPTAPRSRAARITMLKAIAIAIGVTVAAALLLGLMAAAHAASSASVPRPEATPVTGPVQAPTPARPVQPAQPAQPAEPAPEVREHRVVGGDSLSRIALRYQVPLEQVAADNGVADPDRITAGQRLVIRPAPPGVEVIQPGATLTSYAQQLGLSLGELAALNPQITDRDHIVAGGALRVVRSAGS